MQHCRSSQSHQRLHGVNMLSRVWNWLVHTMGDLVIDGGTQALDLQALTRDHSYHPNQDHFFDTMFDQVLGPSEEVSAPELLPATGVPIDWERKLSPVFIRPMLHDGKLYGTRSQTIVVVRHDGTAQVRERSIDPQGAYIQRVTDFRCLLH